MGSKEKEAIVIVLDVGPSMNQAPPGNCTTLETARDVITMILQRKVFAESKDEIALILFGTPGSANKMDYDNITVERPFRLADLDLIQHIRSNIQASTESGDFVDALIVAMDLIHDATSEKASKFTKNRIILFSDLGGEFADDKLQNVTHSLKAMKTEVNMIGLPFDNTDGGGDGDDARDQPSTSRGRGPPRKVKTPQQMAGERLVMNIVEEVNGCIYSFDEVIPAVTMFEKRAVRPTPWKVNLEIGSELKIPVSGYLKVKEATAKSWKSTFQKGHREFTPQTIRSKHLNDDEETEVEKEDQVEGYRYGNDIIPISEEDKKNMDYKKPGKVMQVLGFTKDSKIKKHQQIGNSVYIFYAQPDDQAAAMSFSALVNALYETNSVAIVRRAYSGSSAPRIGFLAPHIKANYEALFYIELPFAEDLRMYTFMSLDNNKRCQPSEEQLAAVDSLIDNMDLMTAEEDEDGDTEALKPKNTLNPYTQRLCQCLMHRALNPDDPIPGIETAIATYLQPCRAVAVQCEPDVEAMQKLFKLEKAKAKENVTGDSIWKASDGGDGEPARKKAKVDDEVNGGDLSMAGMAIGVVTEVGTVDPVGDFKAIISQKDEDRFKEAAGQMGKRILQLVKESFGSQLYGKALDCLRVYREQAIQLSEPETFNAYLRKLKDELKELLKVDFWQDVTKDGLTLIDVTEARDSKVSKDEADKFIQEEEVPMEDEPAAANEEEDADDLLDML
ncbi:X-ray repair cross-complementing protein 5 [Strongylocentrotus purpuratus]|uniref:ATP-dependent DNA helicase II subunit 2 n=1 Tax=Strongylocentrotus purpuratus TaxID=7668 RepID=A0A7M7SZY5_STRPU|nr:X-ray repair cross-complementing protein 5 [Strongylocentrotus purpuratus]